MHANCTNLNCKQCAGDARLRVIAKRSHKLRLATLEALAEGISNANLERIAKHFPNLLPEAVRELKGEVEYIQHNLTQPLPRCRHGKALKNHAGELLEPTCGCRLKGCVIVCT